MSQKKFFSPIITKISANFIRILILIFIFIFSFNAFYLSSLCLADPGTLKWKYEINNPINKRPVIDSKGNIYVATTSGDIYSFTPEGALQNQITVQGNPYINSFSINQENELFIGTDDGNIYVYSKGLELLWNYSFEYDWYKVYSFAFSCENNVYVMYTEGLLCLNNTGNYNWFYHMQSPSTNGIAVGPNNNIYFQASPYLYSLNKNGELNWKVYTYPGYYDSSSVTIDANGRIYVGDIGENLLCFNSDGSLLWESSVYSSSASPIIGSNSKIYMYQESDDLISFNSDGSVNWKFSSVNGEFGVDSSPTLGNDAIYFYCENKLKSIEYSGNKLWEYEINDYVFNTLPVLSKGGTIYIGAARTRYAPANSYYLYAINLDSDSLADSSWPIVGHDLKNTRNIVYSDTWIKDTTAPNISGLKNSTEPIQDKVWVWDSNENATYRYAINQNVTWSFDDQGFNATTNATLNNVNGTWYLHVQAKDQADNLSQVKTVSAVLDNKPPIATIENTPPDLTSDSSVSVTVSGPDVVAYRYAMNNQGYNASTSIDSPIKLTDLSDGSHTLSVIGQDQAGNRQPQDNATTHTWTVDTTPPTTADVSGLPQDLSTAGSTTISVSGEDVVKYKYALDGGQYSDSIAATEATSIDLRSLGDGEHTISIMVCDQAGNWQGSDNVFTTTFNKNWAQQPGRLADIICKLKILTGIECENSSSAEDINGDGKIGMEEILYWLQEISEQR